MSLQAVIELVDKMSAPLRGLTDLLGEFTKGVVEGANSELELMKNSEKAAESQNKLSDSLINVGKALVGLAIGQQIYDQLAQAVALADKFDDMAEKTGIAASSLREYSYAATLSGTSVDTLASALTKLGKSTAKSEEENSKQAAAFNALGVSVEDASGQLKSSEALFGELADKFSELKDGPEKSALAFAIFGSAATEMLPLLNKGSEGIAALREEALLLGQMGPDAFNAFASSSGDLNDGLDKLQTMMSGLFSVIAAELVPIINVLIDSFIESYKQGGAVKTIFEVIKGTVIGLFIPAIKLTINVIRGAIDALEVFGKTLGLVGAVIGLAASGNWSGISEAWKAYKEDIQSTASAHVAFTDKLWDATNANVMAEKAMDNSGKAATKLAPSIAKVAKAAQEVKSSLEEMVAALKLENTGFGSSEDTRKRLEAEAKYRKDIAAGINPQKAASLLNEAKSQIELNRALKEGKDAQDNYLKASATVSDIELAVKLAEAEVELLGASTAERNAALQVIRDEAEIRKITNGLTGDAKIKIEEEIIALQDRRKVAAGVKADDERLNNLTSGNWASQSKKAIDDVQFLYKEYTAGRIKSEEEYVEAVTIRLQAVKDNTKTELDEITIFWQEAAKNMQSSMSSFFFDIMQGNMSDLGTSFKNMLDQMVANALAANLANAIFGANFSKTGQVGGLAATAGTYISSLFARASGGNVVAGEAYQVGEMGIETFVPTVSGTIISNAAMSNASSARNNLAINITAMDSQDVRRALERDNRWLADMINKSTRAYNLGT